MSDFNLFVYGTLRGGGAAAIGGAARGSDGVASRGAAIDTAGAGHGGSAANPLDGCVKLADGTIGGTLYDIDGRFPALVHYGASPVRGEVWRCGAERLAVLDAYEGTATGLFRRIAAEIETDAGERVPCWVYTAGPALSRYLTPSNRVAGGSWQARPGPATSRPFARG